MPVAFNKRGTVSAFNCKPVLTNATQLVWKDLTKD